MDEMYAYEPPLSLWELVEQFVPDNERDEVKNMLGESMVDQSLELHLEVDTLLEIWRDYRDESTMEQNTNKLPEPPALRDRLRQEIMFFVDNIKERASKQGRDAETVLSKHNRNVIEYACDASSQFDSCSRPNTARSSSGRGTPMRSIASSASDRVSSLSSVSSDIEAMHEKLNILEIDEVTQHLRTYLEEEVEQLLKDIEFLQECLEREADFRDNASHTISREPTLTELREERQKLEKVMLTDAGPTPPALRKSPIRPSHRCLQGGDMKIKSPGKKSPSSPAHPLKASHGISTKLMDFPNQNQNVQQNVLNNRTCNDRTENVPNIASAKLVKVATIPVAKTGPQAMTPVPPKSARPNSASRFRKMVLECRDAP